MRALASPSTQEGRIEGSAANAAWPMDEAAAASAAIFIAERRVTWNMISLLAVFFANRNRRITTAALPWFNPDH
ncbi:hypothetical protein [Sinorhizobium medicae]